MTTFDVMRILSDLNLNPNRVFVPGGAGFEIGPGYRGARAMLVTSRQLFQDVAWRILRPAILVRDDQIELLSGHERFQRLLGSRLVESERLTISQVLTLFPVWERFKPLNLTVQAHEVDIIPHELDKSLIPRVLAQFPELVPEWTSKSHPMRVVGMSEVQNWMHQLVPVEVPRYRAMRELRSLLKNGLPVEHQDPAVPEPFRAILIPVTIGVAPFRGERTDLVYVTRKGMQKLRFLRQFEGEPEPMKWFLRDAARIETDTEQVPAGRNLTKTVNIVRGTVTYTPELVKLVTVEGIKGMTLPIDRDLEVLGEPVDLLVDVRSVVSKGAQNRLEPNTNANPPWLIRTLVGATDHGTPMHRDQMVSVRPEVALFGNIRDTMDPVEHLEPGLARRLDEVWEMAHQLGLGR